MELVKEANWRTTAEKTALMLEAGFINLESFQTLTTHPLTSDIQTEEPTAGSDKGDYVAVTGYKP